MRFLVLSCIHLPVHHRSAVITNTCYHGMLLVHGFGYLRSKRFTSWTISPVHPQIVLSALPLPTKVHLETRMSIGYFQCKIQTPLNNSLYTSFELSGFCLHPASLCRLLSSNNCWCRYHWWFGSAPCAQASLSEWRWGFIGAIEYELGGCTLYVCVCTCMRMWRSEVIIGCPFSETILLIFFSWGSFSQTQEVGLDNELWSPHNLPISTSPALGL